MANVDLSYWQDLEDNILQILSVFNNHMYESAILAYTPSEFGNEVIARAQAHLIEKWDQKTTYLPSNAINGPVDLYYLIKSFVPLAQKINSQIIEINKAI